MDHPATQEWKRQRLADAQIALPPALVFVPVDFERDDLGEKLAGAGLQQNAAAFFSWLGVVPYLTEEAIGRTLDYVASVRNSEIRNSEVVFDYMESAQAFSEELRELEKQRAEQLKKMGERSVSRFDPSSMEAMLRARGFREIEDISFQQIAARFGDAVRGLAPGNLGTRVVHARQ